MLKGWVPGRLALSFRTQGVVRYSGRDVGAMIIGVDPQKERASPLSPPTSDKVVFSLAAGGNNIVVGDTMAARIGAGSVIQ